MQKAAMAIMALMVLLAGESPCLAADYPGASTGAELDRVHGVTAPIQEQLNGKLNSSLVSSYALMFLDDADGAAVRATIGAEAAGAAAAAVAVHLSGAGHMEDAEDDNSNRIAIPLNSGAVPSSAHIAIGLAALLPNNAGECFWWNGTVMQTCAQAFGGSAALPGGGVAGQVLVRTEAGAQWQALSDQPAYVELLNEYVALLAAVNAMGGNVFTFTASSPAAYPYYSQSGSFNLDFGIADSNTVYDIASVSYRLDAGVFDDGTLAVQGGSIFRAALAGLAEGVYPFSMRVLDDESPTPNQGDSAEYSVVVDLTDPVLSAGSDGTHGGIGTIQGVVTLTETNYQTPTFQVTGGVNAIGTCSGSYPNYTTPPIDVSGVTADVTITFATADRSGRTAAGSDLTQVFAYAAASATLGHDPETTPTSVGTSPGSFARYVTPANGSFTAQSIRAYFTASGRSWIGGVYADSEGAPGARMVVSQIGTTEANTYNCANLVSPVNIVAGAAYFEGWLVDGGTSIGYGYSAGTNTRYGNNDAYPNLSETYNGANTNSPRALGVYLSSEVCP